MAKIFRDGLFFLMFLGLVFGASVGVCAQGYKLYELPAPDYPKECLDNGIEGTVILFIHVTPKGNLDDVSVLRTPAACPAFAKAAVAAIKRAKFYAPPNGVKVADSALTIPVTFSIDEN